MNVDTSLLAAVTGWTARIVLPTTDDAARDEEIA